MSEPEPTIEEVQIVRFELPSLRGDDLASIAEELGSLAEHLRHSEDYGRMVPKFGDLVIGAISGDTPKGRGMLPFIITAGPVTEQHDRIFSDLSDKIDQADQK